MIDVDVTKSVFASSRRDEDDANDVLGELQRIN